MTDTPTKTCGNCRFKDEHGNCRRLPPAIVETT